MEYVTYILYSPVARKYYIGHTNNIEIRIKQHNNNKLGFTSRYRPWNLVYTESFPTRQQAVRLERYLKSLKNKERLHNYIAGWRSSILPGS